MIFFFFFFFFNLKKCLCIFKQAVLFLFNVGVLTTRACSPLCGRCKSGLGSDPDGVEFWCQCQWLISPRLISDCFTEGFKLTAARAACWTCSVWVEGKVVIVGSFKVAHVPWVAK